MKTNMKTNMKTKKKWKYENKYEIYEKHILTPEQAHENVALVSGNTA